MWDLFNWARARYLAIYISGFICIGVFGAGLLLMSHFDKTLGHNRGWVLVPLFVFCCWLFMRLWAIIERYLLNGYNRASQAAQDAADEHRWQHEQEWRRTHPGP